MTSIRRWLLGWLIAGLGAAALTAGYGIFLTARSEASELFDYELRTVALSLPATITDSKSLTHRSPDFEGLTEDRLVIEIWGNAETPIYMSLGGIDLPRFPAGIRTIEHKEVHWRLFGSQQGDRFVQVAQPVSVRNDLALRLALRTLWPLALFFPVTILIVLLVVGRAGKDFKCARDAFLRLACSIASGRAHSGRAEPACRCVERSAQPPEYRFPVAAHIRGRCRSRTSFATSRVKASGTGR